MAVTPGMPSGELIKSIVPNNQPLGTITATGTFLGPMIAVRIPVAASSTGAAWLNPETSTVLAQAHMVWITAGTGTFDMGVSSDGTTGQDNMINGGTMLAGVYSNGTVTATAVTGVTNNAYQLVKPAGSGTNNSITVIHDESTTGTAVGYLVIKYVRTA